MAPYRKTLLLLGGTLALMSCVSAEPRLSPELRAWNEDHITKGRALFACFRSEYDRVEDGTSPPDAIAEAMYDACEPERAVLMETYLTLPGADMATRRENMRQDNALQLRNALEMVRRKRDGTYIEGVHR